MGRKTYEAGVEQGASVAMPGMDVIVFSRTLPAATHPGVRIVNDDPRKIVAELKEKKGRDIWLFGGGKLFRSLLDAGLVDTVEVAVMPVLLGEGIPLLPPGGSTKLKFVDQKVLPKSGIVTLAYLVEGSRSTAPRIGYIRGQREAGGGKRGRTGTKKSAKKRGKKAR
jgi:dihydrofolate reductase